MHHYTLLNIGDTIEGPAPHERYHTVRHFFFDLAVLTETIEGPENPRAQSSSEESSTWQSRRSLHDPFTRMSLR